MLRKVLFVSTVALLAGSLSLPAQQKEQTREAGGNRNQAGHSAQAHQGQWKNSDHCFASCVALANQEEIAISQLGQSKAQNAEVKKFAQMLVRDHQEYLTKLQKFAPEATQTGYLTTSPEGTRAAKIRTDEATAAAPAKEAAPQDTPSKEAAPKEAAPRDQNATAADNRADRKFQQAQIEREIAQECLNAATAKLNEKSGAEFDKCFIGFQVGMHMGMKSRLTVYQRHASKELAEILAAGLEKTEEHLAKAEELMKTLEQGTTANKAQLDTKTNREQTSAKSDK